MFEEIIDYIRSVFPGGEFIPLHAPVFAGNERRYVMDAIDSTYVSSVGDYVTRFEEMMQDVTGAGYAIGTVNGTAALHMALLAAGVSQGTEVLTQPVSFVATANAIKYCNAEPVFLDVDRDTLGLSPDAVENFLASNASVTGKHCINKTTGRTISACVPMHTFGHPCRIDRLVEVCERYFIPVVEDAAESLGSAYKGKCTGTFGKLGCCSLNGNKIVTSGGGGCILTDDEHLGRQVRHKITTAKIPHPYLYDHDCVGYNFRMPNLNAALACAQLEQLDDFISIKRSLAEQYNNFFRYPGLTFITEPSGAKSNYWLNTILFEDKESCLFFLEETNRAGIMTRPVWRLLNRLPMYASCLTDDLTNAEWLAERLVNIPSSVNAAAVERARSC